MSTKTYTALASIKLFEYLDSYGSLQDVIREKFKTRLFLGEKADTLVKEFQPEDDVNKRQINSICIQADVAIASALEQI